MSTKLYVGGLPYSTIDSELTEMFSQYGTVASARVITDKFTGQSRGFGFVEMESEDEAQRAIEGLNGSKMKQRSLIVNIAKPMERRERTGSGGNRW